MKKYLVQFMAKMCYYAQEHLLNEGYEPVPESDLYSLMECTSYQVACFLAQNTVDGKHGVEADIVIDKLCQEPRKSEKQWEKIIKQIVNDHGGMTPSKS